MLILIPGDNMKLKGSDWSQKQFITEHFPLRADSEGWRNASVKKAEKIYTINGVKYMTLAKKERYLSFFTIQRIAGIVLGLFLSIISVGAAPMFSKSVWQMFSGRQTLKIMRKQEGRERSRVEEIFTNLDQIPESKSKERLNNTVQLPHPGLRSVSHNLTSSYQVFPREKTPEEIREIAKSNEPNVAFLRDMQIEQVESRRKNEINHLNNTNSSEKKTLEIEELMTVVNACSSQAQEQIRKEFSVKKIAVNNHYQDQLAKIEKSYAEGIKAAHEWYQHKLNEVNARADKLIAQKEDNRRRANESNAKLQDFKSIANI